MKASALIFFRVLCLICISSSVLADDQRVLLSFDNSGHKVRQIVRSQAVDMLLPRRLASRDLQRVSPDIEALISTLQSGIALLIWTDDDGNVYLNTQEPDPRISHAPAHINGVDESRQGTRSGAWLVTGPESATSIIILLAADISLGLAFEQWEVSLTSW